MSTYSGLTDTGIQSLSAGVGALQVHVNTIPVGAGSGHAYPTNWYHVGFIRAGDGTAFWRAIPIEAEDAWLEVPDGATEFGYSIMPGGDVDVTEVIGPNPFAGPPGPTGATGSSFAAVILEAHLTGNVTMTTANTVYDAVTLSLPAGTHLLFGRIAFHDNGGGSTCVGQLYDGTAVVAQAETGLSASFDGSVALFAAVVLTGTTTVRLRGIGNGASKRMDATTIVNGGGVNAATSLLAVQVA